MNKCSNPECSNDAKVKYCSRSCAAQINNRLKPKRQMEGSCSHCGEPTSTRFKYCPSCWENRQAVGITLSDEENKASSRERVNKWRTKVKLMAVEHLGGKCSKCGYNKSIRALQFHHLDPKEKEFGISAGTLRSWEKTEKELSKCVLLCANCHAEEHERIEDEVI